MINISDIWDGDQPITISELEKKLAVIRKKYGVKSTLKFDAGYNNVSVEITPSKKQNEKIQNRR